MGLQPTWGLVCMRTRSSGLTQIPDRGPPFSHSLRAICTVLLDPRDPLLQSERTQGLAADLVYGRAKCLPMLGSLKRSFRNEGPKGAPLNHSGRSPLLMVEQGSTDSCLGIVCADTDKKQSCLLNRNQRNQRTA